MSYDKYFQKRKEALAKKNRKNSRGRKVILGLISVVLAGGGAWCLYSGDQALLTVNKILDRVEITLMGEANASAASSEADSAETKEKTGEKLAGTIVSDKKESKKVWTDDEIALFNKLEARKLQLDAREAELTRLEEELQKQKEGLEKRLADLEDVRGKISSKLEEKIRVDQQKVESLMMVFANMKPASAAKVIEGINEDLAVEVLAKMKNKNAAEILNLMDAERAKRMTERFAGYREPAAK